MVGRNFGGCKMFLKTAKVANSDLPEDERPDLDYKEVISRLIVNE
jgi:hypothetical protein